MFLLSGSMLVLRVCGLDFLGRADIGILPALVGFLTVLTKADGRSVTLYLLSVTDSLYERS